MQVIGFYKGGDAIIGLLQRYHNTMANECKLINQFLFLFHRHCIYVFLMLS